MIQEKRELEQRIERGRPAPSPVPKRLPLEAIETCEAVFQLRHVRKGHSEYFSGALAKALKQQEEPLAPVVVYWAGDSWICVDGHHRLDAYRRASYRKQVPVVVAPGTLEEAIAAAAAANSHDKLPMAPHEKRNAAWRLCVGTALSKAQIAKAASVSERTVANMRQIKRRLIEDMKMRLEDVAELGWGRARNRAKGRADRTIEEAEDARDELAKDLAERLRKHFGGFLKVNPSVLARALWHVNGRFPAALSVEFVEQGLVEYTEDGEINHGGVSAGSGLAVPF